MNEYYSSKYYNSELSDEDIWIYFDPIMDFTYEINTFDDGNQKYKDNINKWYIFGQWRGKCALVNYENPLIKISSISNWKISKLF